jgi:tetratricopeptide (TPR) repeat protein
MPSVEVHNKAVLLFKEAGMDRMLGKSLNNLGYARSLAGDTDGALQAYKDALVALRKVRDERGEAITGFNLGNLLAESGDHKRALELLTNSLALMRKAGMDNEAKEASLVLRSIKGPVRR